MALSLGVQVGALPTPQEMDEEMSYADRRDRMAEAEAKAGKGARAEADDAVMRIQGAGHNGIHFFVKPPVSRRANL